MGLNKLNMVGVAPVSRFAEAPEGRRPTDILPSARSVVVGLIHILDSVCDDLPYSRYEYTNQFFGLNGILNETARVIASFLEEEGYRTLPIPAAYPRLNKMLAGVLSHRHAAVLAGLGEFALNNLLTTEKYGSRVRLVSIVTEAELDPDEPNTKNLCEQYRDTCKMACIRNCPTGSLKAKGPIDKPRCLHYQEQILPWSVGELRCGMCLASCPIGQRQFKEPAQPEKRSEQVLALKEQWTGAKW